MLYEPFATGNAFIYRIDPRIRIAAATLYTFIVALSNHFTTLWAAMTVSITLVLLARLDPKEFFKRFVAVNIFLLLLWLVLPLTFQNSVTFSLGPLKVYHSGILMSARISLKANAIFLSMISLVATMTFSTLGSALDRLGMPDKIVHLLLMTYRYIFVIEQEYHRLLRAARIRGFRPKTNLHTYKTYAYIVGMLFVRSAIRAEHVYNAMRCRGFKHRFYCLHDVTGSGKEWLFAAAMTGAITALIYLEWLSKGVSI